jgi:DNA-binding transcriptional regulator PaaX
MPRGPGKVQQKIILLLWGGLALGLSHSPKTSFKILGAIAKEWKVIDKKHLKRAISDLYRSKLIEEKQNKDGTITIVLSAEGKNKALTYDLDKMKVVVPKKWDGKWRIVMFDIPEWGKGIRDALREHLRDMEFYEFQKSVFVHPFDCRNEIEYLIEFYDIRKFVRFILAESLDNELHLKNHFGLN